MKKVGLTLAPLATLGPLELGCRSAVDATGADATAEGAAARPPRRGERIVIEPEAAEFFEVRVLEVLQDKVKVQLASGESKTVALSDTYRLDAGKVPEPGSSAICRVAPGRWLACRVVGVTEGGVDVSMPGEPGRRLPPDALLTPTALTDLNIQRRFERAKDRDTFEQELARAGPPRAPEAWKPSPAEQVVVRLGGEWRSGKIYELGKKELRVELAGGARIVEVERADVIPAPPYTPPSRRGEYALVRPLSPVGPWTPVRVETAGESEISVRDASGARRNVTAADLVPLGR